MLKYLGKIWTFITYLRVGLANFIFIVLLIAIIAALASPRQTTLPKNAPLLISISGTLVDQLTYQPSIFDLLQEEMENPETLVRDVIFAIEQAKDDERISAIIFNLNRMQGGSFSKLEEIGQAIDHFKTSGKPVLAYADNYSQSQYFLASYADTIYLNSMGTVALNGFGYFGSYFKEAADKLSLKFHLFKVGDYKDAAEPYVRNSMSEASREHNSSWISELWGRYTSKIETHRSLPSGAIEDFIVALQNTLKDNTDSFATILQNAGLVDTVVSRAQLNAALIEQFGQDSNSDFFKAIDYHAYLSEIQPTLPSPSNNIGLITATGTIVDGNAPKGRIGGNDLSALIRQAADDDSLAALIIRIDSGGGSAFASEVIRDEIEHAKSQGLPIYVSMGSVAASGGYWIASAADEIWALPSTITGSIGVWGLIPNISESLKRIGVHSDGFGTTPLADIYHFDRPLSPEAKQVFQSGVENIYRQFINLVAQAREKSPQSVHEIAQGRVWTGEKAYEFGLVDQLGTLNDLVATISERHELGDPRIKAIEPPMSPSEQFIRTLMEETQHLSKHIVGQVLGDSLAPMVRALPKENIANMNMLVQSNKEFNVLAQCLPCLAP